MACLEAQGAPPHPEQKAPRSSPRSDLEREDPPPVHHNRKGEPATDVDAVRYALSRLSLTLPAMASALWERHDGRFYDGNGTIMEEYDV